MKVTLGQLLGLAGTAEQPGALAVLSQNKMFAARLSYRIAKLVKAVGAELGTLQAERNKLIEKYGTVHEDDTKPSVRPGDDNWDEFVKEHDQLVTVEVELGVDPVELPPEAPGISAQVFIDLEGLVTVKGEPDEPKPGPTKVVE